MNKNGMTGTGSGGVDDKSLGEKIDSLKETVKDVVDQGAQRVDALKTKVIDVKDQAINRGGDVLGRVTEMIKAHPIKAVGIAFGAGYIGMRLFRR